MTARLRNALDTLQSFHNRLESDKRHVAAQLELGSWTISVDGEDNMIIKNGVNTHTTITPSGSVVSSAINVIGGPTLVGSILTGITDKNIVSRSRNHTQGYDPMHTTNIIDANSTQAPFGYSIAMSNDGKYVATSDGIDGSAAYGRVNVFKYNPNTGFTDDVIISPPSGTLDATSFGTSIKFTNNALYLFISEPGIATNSGAVHIYSRAFDNSWSVSQSISAPIASGQFGCSIDISQSGDYLVVGAWQARSGAGAVYIYAKSGSTWVLASAIDSPNSNINNYQFGRKVRLSNDASLLVVSATGSTALYDTSGSVILYTKSATSDTWIKNINMVSPVLTSASTLFGVSLEISDDNKCLFIGDATVPAESPTGSVYIYMNKGNGWNLTQTLSAGRNTNAMFGWSIAERGGMLIVGSPGDNANGANSGVVMVFIRTGYTWIFSHIPVAGGNPTVGELHGYTIAAADSNNFIASSPYEGDGNIYYYRSAFNNFAGVLLATGDIAPVTTGTYDVGLLTEPYTNVFVQNAPTVTSDRSAKKNIRHVERGLDFIRALQPVQFSWLNDDEVHTGFIGQDVADVVSTSYGGVVIRDDQFHLRPSEFLAPLVAAFKDLDKQVSELEA